jgi:hypothetical protein
MSVKFANNAHSTLASSVSTSATSITVASGHGARFPSLSGSEFFYATLIDTSNNLEIVKVTARSTDVLTATRAQESTSARAFASGDRIELRVTAQSITDATTIQADQIVNSMIATDAVNADSIVANAVGASELNVSGNGTSGQVLLSDGDGTMTWGSGAKVRQVVQGFNNSRAALSATAARVVYWNALNFTKQLADSKLHVQVQIPLGGGGDTYPGFGIDFIRFSTSGYSSNGSDIFGYLNNTRATSNNMGAFIIGNFLYDSASTNIAAAGSVYIDIGYDSASGDTWRPAPIWNPSASEDARGRQSFSTIVVTEIE